MKKLKIIMTSLALIILLLLTSCELTQKIKITYYDGILQNVTVSYNKGTYIDLEKANNDSNFSYDYDGYGNIQFIGWYEDSSYNTPVVFPFEAKENKNLYAKISKNTIEPEKQTYTASFFVDNELYQTINYDGKEIIINFDEPNKDGYDFDGWYDEEFNTKYTFPLNIDNASLNLNFFAKWIKNNQDKTLYEVTFMDEDNILKTINIYEGDILDNYTPTKDDYIFVGWYIDQALNNEFDFESPINSSTIIYAKWKPAFYNVTFMDGTKELKTEKIAINTKVENYTPTKDDYIFVGWYIDQALNNEFDFESPIVKTTTIFAKWRPASFNVIFKDDTKTLKNEKVAANSKIESYTPVKDGYIFEGWYSDLALTNKFDFNQEIIETTTIYAKWNIGKFTVIYMDGNDKLKEISVSHNTILEEYIPSKDHYSLEGWYSDLALTNKFDTTKAITSSITLYANWTIDFYKITYYIDSNVFNVENVNYNGTAKGPSSNPTKDGYVFEGWYIDPNLSSKYNFSRKVTESFNLYANFVECGELKIQSYNGYAEGIYIILQNININVSDYSVSYSLTNQNDYTEIDKELIRKENSKIRADILGLTPEIYDVKIEANGITEIIKGIQVYEQDRSGYAHFNYSAGVGAYNNDGTLKSNTVIVYVTDATKNTVKAKINGKEYTGLIKILQAQSNSSNPLDIRILDTIKTPQWNSKKYNSAANTDDLVNEIIASYNGASSSSGRYTASSLIAANANSYSDDLAKGITVLDGLTSWGSGTDSYWNMCDIQKAKNVTVEGVGENAGLFQWGFTWKNCTSIEVKNLTFDSYTEDACSFEGAEESSTISGFSTGHVWIHHNTFTKGSNRWDVSDDQDKYDGDGATDFKRLAYATLSYNHYYQNHKTGLVGGSDTQKTACLTFHHNYYELCQSRLPFVRQANVHMYNNYYYGSTGNNMQVYAGAYAFIENCYFKNVSKTFTLVTSDSKVPAVKSYNNTYENCSNYNGATIVLDRTTAVSNDNIYGQTFDTNSNLFYYDSTNEKSDVTIMNEVSDVPSIVTEYAGAGSNYYKSILVTQANVTKYTITLMNGSTVFDTIKVIENTAAKKPSTYPTSNSGIFEAWVDENNNEYNWSNLVNSDIVLYAKYKSEPTYESLANNSNAIIAEDFNNSTANQKLTRFTDYNTKGIYYSNNGTNADSTAYAIYTGSSIKTVDDDSSCAAQINVSLGQEYKSGIIKGWVELSIGTNVGSKWALISFVDKNNQVLFKLGADSNKNLAYAVGNTAMETGTSLISNGVSKNATFKIYYEFDLNNGTASLIINNVTYLNNYSTGIYELAGFYTMTNGSGTGDSARVITLDNIAVIKED